MQVGCLLVAVMFLVAAIGSNFSSDKRAARRSDRTTNDRPAPANPSATRIERLDVEARAIPASDAEGNLKAYQELLKLAPDNTRYRMKVAYYSDKLSEQEAETPAPDTDLPEYSIVKSESMGTIKRSLDVRLNDRISTDDLEAIARHLYVPGYERTFICYYLPDMQIGSGAWATTHFNPSLEVSILGSTKERAAEMQSEQVEERGREHVGSWMVAGIASRRIDIYEDDDGFVVRTQYADGGSSSERAAYKKVKGRMAYVEDEASYGEHYVVNERGQLEIWDQEGLIERANAIR